MAVLVTATAGQQAYALIIHDYVPWAAGSPNPNAELINTTPPADDPGWANLGSRTGVYLGDHWFLSAWHTGGELPVELAGGVFPAIPGSAVRIQNANGSLSDVFMYRLGVDQESGLSPEELDPSIRSITIANRLVPTTSTLTMLGMGSYRRLNATPQIDPGTGDRIGQLSYFDANGVLVPSPVAGGFTGYGAQPIPFQWQWGQNQRFGSTLLATGPVADTTVFRTRFDQFGVPYEAQASGGDSAGPVFWKDGNEWVLAGVHHVVFSSSTTSQSSNLLWTFGAATGVSDLSMATYRNQITTLRNAPQYSIMGDINLDGVVTGSIVNGVATGDLAALANNWLVDSGDADIHSWMNGDLNQDGQTDLYDFVQLRSALGGTISTQSFALLVGAVGVPEPSGAVLLSVGAVWAVARRRR